MHSANKIFKAGDTVANHEAGPYTVYGYTEDQVELIAIDRAGNYHFLDPQECQEAFVPED